LNDSLAELLAGKVQGRLVLVHDDHSTQFGERPRLQQHCGALSSVARAEHAGLRPILRECCHDTSASEIAVRLATNILAMISRIAKKGVTIANTAH
jgi:hypothetical protein